MESVALVPVRRLADPALDRLVTWWGESRFPCQGILDCPVRSVHSRNVGRCQTCSWTFPFPFVLLATDAEVRPAFFGKHRAPDAKYENGSNADGRFVASAGARTLRSSRGVERRGQSHH